MHKRLPYSEKDFSWLQARPADFARLGKEAITEKKLAHERVTAVPKEKRTFGNTLFALEVADAQLHASLAKINFLLNVSPDKKVRDAAHKADLYIRKELINIEFDPRLYRAVKEYAAQKEKLDLVQAKLLKDYISEYKRMGFDLPEAKRTLLKKNLKLISSLESQFQKNISDYKAEIIVTRNELAGLPENYIEALKQNPKGKYHVSLAYPELVPFMELAQSNEKRKELAEKNSQKGGKKNLEILEKLIRLRDAKAKLLGYKNHAEFKLEDRMAKNPAAVSAFLNGLMRDLAPAKNKEFKELTDYKRKETGDKNAKLLYHDSGYYLEKMKKEMLSLDSEALREYFPFTHIRQSVFDIFSKLLSVQFKKVDWKLYHPDAELFQISDKSGALIGYFILDLYPREGKYSHACASDIVKPRVTSMKNNSKYETPVSAMIANFAKPLAGRPSLMSHDEVETYFHEFGHLLHSLLSTALYPSQSGFATSWDFVETPSQFLENWTWGDEMLSIIGKHYKTGKKIPQDMMDALEKSRTFRMASWTTGQLVNSLLDLDIHSKIPKKKLNSISQEISFKYSGIQPYSKSLFPAGFGHLGGDYDAGYYSYLWSLVYAYDLFTRFQKEGLLNPKTGMDYRKWILEKGSSMEEMDLLKNFLHRKPNNKAFLKELGIK